MGLFDKFFRKPVNMETRIEEERELGGWAPFTFPYGCPGCKYDKEKHPSGFPLTIKPGTGSFHVKPESAPLDIFNYYTLKCPYCHVPWRVSKCHFHSHDTCFLWIGMYVPSVGPLWDWNSRTIHLDNCSKCGGTYSSRFMEMVS